jgi:hypothetical protein
MEKIKVQLQTIIAKKTPLHVILILSYLLIIGFIKWTIHPPSGIIFYVLGGAIGIYLLEAAEEFAHLTPSPFRTIVFAAAFIMVSVFILTSSGSFIAAGLVLSLYFNMMLLQWTEWKQTGAMNSWYRLLAHPLSTVMQERILWVFSGIFILLTAIFIHNP